MRTVIFAVLLGAACAASAQLYRWTDDKGRVHLTDTPPPPTAKNVRSRSPAAPAASADGENQPYSLQVAAKNFPVTLFTAPDCAPCGTARSLLNARGVPFQEVSAVDQRQREQLQQAVGSLSVPSLRVGSSVQKGFEQGAYDSLLDSAGYPRAGILPPRHQVEPKPAPPKPASGDAQADEEPAARRGPYTPR
jgi:glutaredoxin